jgi:hypothetical protein
MRQPTGVVKSFVTLSNDLISSIERRVSPCLIEQPSAMNLFSVRESDDRAP